MKTLTREEAGNAGARAYQVVNGFAVVRNQQATDALNLAHTCEQLYANLDVARTKLAELVNKSGNPADAGSYAKMFDDLFESINKRRSNRK